MNTVYFPTTPHVVIWAATVRKTQRERRRAVQVHRHDPPVVRYFVDFVESDSSTFGAWDGAHYDAALLAAQEWGVRIVDETSEMWGAHDALLRHRRTRPPPCPNAVVDSRR